MNAQNTVTIANQRLVKQFWIALALSSLIPIFVSLYLVSALLDPQRPEMTQVFTMLGFAMVFSAIGSYIIHMIWRKLRSVSDRAVHTVLPDGIEVGEGQAEVVDEIGQLDNAINRFTQQLRSSMTELHQKAAELSTAKKQLEEANQQLQRIDKMKSDFLRFISHEFRSPLMCVRMSLSSLLEEPEPPLAEDQEKSVELALRSSERLLRLINQMIDLTKLRHARPSQEKKDVEIQQLVHRVMGNFRDQFEEKKIRLQSNGNTLQANVQADPEGLEVALRHILNNVVENTPSEGETKVSVNSGEGEVQVVFADNGPRVIERKFGDLFDGLVRSYEGNDPRWRNDVLGLTLAKEIVALQGGRLEVDYNPRSQSQIIVRLPKGEN